jgi:hypothetical protein
LSISPVGIAYGGAYTVYWNASTGAVIAYYNLQETIVSTNTTTVYTVTAPATEMGFNQGPAASDIYKYQVAACTAGNICSAYSLGKSIDVCPSGGCP